MLRSYFIVPEPSSQPMLTRRGLISLLVLILALHAGSAFGYSAGIAGYSGKSNFHCTVCHSGGQTPSVAFSGPTTLQPNQIGNYAFTVTSSDPDVQTGAGFDVAASAGTLQVVSGQKEHLLTKELTHTAPQPNDANGEVTWTFNWKAPATAGNYTLWGAGNSVNQDTGNSGDRSATTVLVIAVGNVTPLSTVTPTIALTPTPSRTATATRTPTGTTTFSPTATATAGPTDTPTPLDTETPPPTLTATPTQPDTPAPTDTASPTPTPVPPSTASATATPSPTATPIPTDTATPTLTPTPAQRGDANCDTTVTAADLPAVVTLYVMVDAGTCGADINQNGVVDQDDVNATVGLIFEP